MAATAELEMTRLQKAVQTSWETLRPFRMQRRALLREFAGHRYGKRGAPKPVYLNLIKQCASAYQMALSGEDPRILATAEKQALKGFAFRYQQALNRLIKRIDLKASIDTSIMNAYFGVGIVKVCLADGFEVEISGAKYDLGYPSAKPISLEDWVHDTAVDCFDDVRFCGHLFSAPLERVKADGRFDREVTKDLTPTSKYPRRRDGESSSVMDDGVDRDEIEDMILLGEFYLPFQNRIITVPVREDGQIETVRLNDEKWVGPENGPYHRLAFDDLLDNTMPVPPAYELFELHLLYNDLLRKQARQARRQKDIYLFKGSNADAVERANSTPDGEGCKTEDPDGVKFVKMGGADQGTFAFASNVYELFNHAAGNLQAILGLGPMSSTAGQDRMIREDVSNKIAKMQGRVTRFTTGICKDLGLMLWNHEGWVEPGSEDLGNGISYDTTWTPAHRRGMFVDYNIEVQAYSQAYKSPSDKSKAIIGFIQGVMLPAMPMLQQQGLSLSFQKIARMFSEYENLPEVIDIIEAAQPLTDRDQGAGRGASHQQMKPAITQRTQIRQNAGPQQAPVEMPMNSGMQMAEMQ